MVTKITKETKTKKKPTNGKRKGNAFEGKIAKALSAALPLNFIRSPGSGARVGGMNFEKFGGMFGEDTLKLFVADVVPTNERDTGYNFLWSVECKSYATVDTFNHIVAGTSKIFGWFEESVVDSAKVGKKPMLICKWNNSNTYVIVEEKDQRIEKPELIIHNTAYGKPLAVYMFDKVINNQDFWVEKS